jgi:hypothetical protein
MIEDHFTYYRAGLNKDFCYIWTEKLNIMTKTVLVKKHSGEKQPFSKEKFTESIVRAGATRDIAREVTDEVMSNLYNGISTREIYKNAFQILRHKMRSLAARYSLKSALLELGPSGYPFEKFVGEIFRKEGFEVKTGQTIFGKCIQHEVDVVAEKENLTIMVECKYGNEQNKISGVQVPLYVNSRFNDIKSVWAQEERNHGKEFQGWIVTNTRFSSDAEIYGTCAGLHLVSWGFPDKGNLREIVESKALFPVTAITTLNKKERQYLLEKGIILAEQLLGRYDLLEPFEFGSRKKESVIKEIEALSAVGKIL